MAALAIACTASLASAQTTSPPADATTESAKPAPAEPMDAKPAPAEPMNQAANEAQKPPLPGANSFTEGQARDRIAKAGFEDVQGLKKDDQGVWRGQAKKSGQQVSVALDYRGNVVQQ
jgi:putative membrane protein